MSVRQSLPVKIRHIDAVRREDTALDITGRKPCSVLSTRKAEVVVKWRGVPPRGALSTVKSFIHRCTGISSDILSAPFPSLAPPQCLKPSSVGLWEVDRVFPLLGFVVHTDNLFNRVERQPVHKNSRFFTSTRASVTAVLPMRIPRLRDPHGFLHGSCTKRSSLHLKKKQLDFCRRELAVTRGRDYLKDPHEGAAQKKYTSRQIHSPAQTSEIGLRPRYPVDKNVTCEEHTQCLKHIQGFRLPPDLSAENLQRLSTRTWFIQLERPLLSSANPTLLGSVLGNEAKASLKHDLQGKPNKENGPQDYSLLDDLEMFWAPHSRDLYVQSSTRVVESWPRSDRWWARKHGDLASVSSLNMAQQFTSPTHGKENNRRKSMVTTSRDNAREDAEHVDTVSVF
ncbi:hypothetical protein OS493_040082 [Desmophyllum pertusum]|uniref:Uncharacterized protein n=1 Tax=Desmophyllum pertusum TaxID=174260 RepID=A0A9W9YTY8_9CNID|nr:hypothetical protein OS493_040082 [Desmophyllum pertusum]